LLTSTDAVLDIADRDVAVTGVYAGRRRMTLTLPTLNRARQILLLQHRPKLSQCSRQVSALARLPWPGSLQHCRLVGLRATSRAAGRLR
jgi:hypothetical protein